MVTRPPPAANYPGFNIAGMWFTNRSEWIRRIFTEHGPDLSTNQVCDMMLDRGMTVSESLVNKIRREFR